MASIERTAYPRFRRLVTARELVLLSPTEDDVVWAREHTRSGEHLFSLVLSLVCFGQLGYFPRRGEVPLAVVEHVRRELGRSYRCQVCWCVIPKPGVPHMMVVVAEGRGCGWMSARSARRVL